MKTKLLISTMVLMSAVSSQSFAQDVGGNAETTVQGEMVGNYTYRTVASKKLNKGGAWFKKGESLEETFDGPVFIKDILVTAKEGFWTNARFDVLVDGRFIATVAIGDSPVYSIPVGRPAQQVILAFHGSVKISSVNFYVREMCDVGYGNGGGFIGGGMISNNPTGLGRAALQTVMQLERVALGQVPELLSVKREAMKLAAKTPNSGNSQETRAQALLLVSAIDGADGFIQQILAGNSPAATNLAERLLSIKERIKDILR